MPCSKVLLLPYDFMVEHPRAAGILVAELTSGSHRHGSHRHGHVAASDMEEASDIGGEMDHHGSDEGEVEELAARLGRSFYNAVAGHSAQLALHRRRRQHLRGER